MSRKFAILAVAIAIVFGVPVVIHGGFAHRGTGAATTAEAAPPIMLPAG